MKSGAEKYVFAAAVWSFFLAASAGAQSMPPVGYATNFSSVAYFEAPHEQQVEYKLTGAEALPLPGTLFDFKKMKVEKFNTAGKLEAVVEAPRCTYAPLDGVANSAGHLDLTADDGRVRVEGDGFLWRQNEHLLVISNHVRTVIELPPAKLNKP